MFIAIIDFETDGLSPKTDNPTEICAIVYDTHTKRYVKTYESFLGFPDPNQTAKREMCENLTGITENYVREFWDGGRNFQALVTLMHMGIIEYAVAYNAPFDKGFFKKACEQLGLEMPETPWICAKADYPYHLLGIKPSRLIYTAAELGILNPFPHRGIADCLTTMLITQKFDWQDILDYAVKPMVRYIAQVSYDDREKARAAGFYFEPMRKVWYRDMKASEVVEFPFPVRTEQL